LFLPELRQIFTNFDNFWQNDGKEAKIVRGALIFHMTKTILHSFLRHGVFITGYKQTVSKPQVFATSMAMVSRVYIVSALARFDSKTKIASPFKCTYRRAARFY